MSNIARNINSISERIQSAAKKSDRNPADITLLAVSKKQSSAAIRQAYHHGQRHFGENYLQEALQKQDELADIPDIEWHFIGPVQSNKTRKIAENFDWLHTIDRISIAERISRQRPIGLPPLNVCLQVNIDHEPNKAGVDEKETAELAVAVTRLPAIKLRGLMTIPSAANGPEQQHAAFAKLNQLLKQLQSLCPELATLDTLSMGMSADLEVAVEEGSTLVRIGTDIFGLRQ
ncbi:MAG: YggS family pyridoxal phosphate-dependent enzyme [Porticoccaceae bacterium]|nr:YggS family pyridoxal phosphate-dependent enzyme [Pseudomonadales bacterium]MCP5173059.1 YggS family pyridoxal phosphate-dependent enzyme [Pseudomonadales bacterium]MCP5302533.1 YggS family pyridoxal phosphate-dependent enzyme [Pseudomonadales bacterium]